MSERVSECERKGKTGVMIGGGGGGGGHGQFL